MTRRHAMASPARPAVPDAVLTFETTVIPHTRHTEAKAAIRELHGRYRPREDARRFKARALLIVGAAGSGKTTALEDYMADYPDRATEDGDIRRIVYVEAPERTTRRALVGAILGAYGYRARDHWNTSEVIEKIAFYAEETGTEMIFIDEGHHMVNENNAETTAEVTEFIKSLLNRVKVQIVIAGLPRLLDIAVPGERTMQLRRRLQPTVILKPYDWATRSGRTMFSGVLGVMEKMLGLPEASGLAKHEMAKRIYVATGGEIGIVSKYLSQALSTALANGRRSIDLDLLGQVHAGWYPVYQADVGDMLDFDALLEDEPVETGMVPLRLDNPFLCSGERLREIWLRDTDPPPPMNMSRVTKLRGRGAQPLRPFIREGL
ncbi:TniB family NTP-binding protein [Sphingomonas turrisvirgatae]|nr:TniB family NTP-binding protein [Sphingomonas turrisvirgatae]